MIGFFCLYACDQRATCAGSAPTETNLKSRPSSLISCASFWTYDGWPPRNIPCDPDSGLLKMLSLPLSPCHVLNCGYCFMRYVGMNQPICPMTPFEPRFWSVPLLTYFWFTLRSMLFQSSGTTSTLPSAIAWKSGVLSGSFSMLTLHPRFFSSTYLSTYTFAVAPAHAFSSIVTVPHEALFALPPASALADTASALTAATANATTTQRRDHL